jgi:cyclase
MLRPRIIPCLLVSNSGLVKTGGFSDPKYVGDPLNAVRIFNEKEVDELMVLDIDATRQSRGPDQRLIEALAGECQMPLTYGGGITTVQQIESIVGLGVEKVSMSAAAVADPQLISRAAEMVGGQSLVVVMDVKRHTLPRRYEVYTHNGTRRTKLDPVEFACTAQRAGAGEVVVNSIDRDGRMRGYDLDLIARVREAVDLPVTALGGAGSLDDMAELLNRFGTMGVAAGSLFVFKGAYRAVLINYPDSAKRDELVRAMAPSRSAF